MVVDLQHHDLMNDPKAYAKLLDRIDEPRGEGHHVVTL
jgi:hypothetical protein